jgi:hypothetical protein
VASQRRTVRCIWQFGRRKRQDVVSRWALEIIADEIQFLTPKPKTAIPEAVAA